MCRHLKSPNRDQEFHVVSVENASNLVHPPISVHSLYDNEFQSRFQGETAQSMFERLSRLFQESDVNKFIIFYNRNILFLF